MAKYLLLKHYRGASAPVNDVPMDQWRPDEVEAHIRGGRAEAASVARTPLNVRIGGPPAPRASRLDDRFLERFSNRVETSRFTANVTQDDVNGVADEDIGVDVDAASDQVEYHAPFVVGRHPALDLAVQVRSSAKSASGVCVKCQGVSDHAAERTERLDRSLGRVGKVDQPAGEPSNCQRLGCREARSISRAALPACALNSALSTDRRDSPVASRAPGTDFARTTYLLHEGNVPS